MICRSEQEKCLEVLDNLALETASDEPAPYGFHDALREAIHATHMTVTAFANLMHISRVSMSDAVRGKRSMKKDNARRAVVLAIAEINGEIIKKRGEIERLREVGERLKEEYRRKYGQEARACQ